MNDCTTCRDRMIEALYGELGPADKAGFESHVAACPDCAEEYASLGETLRVMDKRERPDPGPEFWDGYWDRLSRRRLWEATEEGRGPSITSRVGRLFFRVPRWAYQAAGATALLLAGILIGSRLVGPGGPTTAPGTTAAISMPAPTGAVAQAGDFIDRSKVLLLGLVNYDASVEDAYAFDLDGKKAVSRVLAAEAPGIRKGLKGPGQRRLRELVGDLEVIMMQIANLEAGQDVDGVEIVKQGVDSRGIFLKIDLDRMAREARSAPAGGAAAPVKKSQV